MLDRDSWLPQAEALREGERRKVDHDCGPGRTMMVSRSDEGMRAWCFRCNDGGSASPPAESLANKLAKIERMNSEDAQAGRKLDLPEPCVKDVGQWPVPARLWLYKAGLGRAEIGRLGAYYHPPTNRVVVPVFEPTGRLTFWQARSIDGRRPKYLSPNCDRSRVLPRYGDPNQIPTLTEDILSAFKVGLVGGYGWALMGTKASAALLAALMSTHDQANVWLDPDGAGQRGASKLQAQLRAYNIAPTVIQSAVDPKLLHTAEIRRALHVT